MMKWLFETFVGRALLGVVVAVALWSYVVGLIEDKAVAEAELETSYSTTEKIVEDTNASIAIDDRTSQQEEASMRRFNDLDQLWQQIRTERDASSSETAGGMCLDAAALDRLQRLREAAGN